MRQAGAEFTLEGRKYNPGTMIPSEKEVNEALLSALENLYVEHVLLKGRLRRARAAGYRDNADTIGVGAAAEIARTSFRRQYAQLIHSLDDWRRFLQNLPSSDIVH